MANCNIIKEDGKVVHTEAPNGNRSKLFDALSVKLKDKNEALKFWLTSKTDKFISSVTHPKLSQHRVQLLKTLDNIKPSKDTITVTSNGVKTTVNLKDLQFTNVKRVGFNSITAYANPVNAVTNKVTTPTEVIIKPESLEDLIKVNKYVFGLSEQQAISAATISDLVIESMAKKAKISKQKMYDKLGFGKTTADKLKGTNALFQSGDIWKSTAAEGLSKVAPGTKLTPNKWIQTIVNKGGKGTANELKWIGLQDFMDDYIKENKVKSVPKDVVEDYVKDNKIEIREVTKGTGPQDYFLDSEEDNKMYLPNTNITIEYDSTKGVFNVKDDGDKVASRRSLGPAKDYAISYVKEAYDYIPEEPMGSPQYGEYQTPEGANYREILLIMPDKAFKNDLKIEEDEEETNYQEDGKEYVKATMRIEGGSYTHFSGTREEAIAWSKKQTPYSKGEDYSSSHWQEGNILAHIRMNERVLEETGERVLFLEEVQSDWAQDGRKEGFASPAAAAKYKKAKKQAMLYNIAGAELQDYVNENKTAATHAATMLHKDGKGYAATIDRGEYTLYHAVNRFGLPLGEVGDYKVITEGQYTYIGTKVGDPAGLYYGTPAVAEKALKEQVNTLDTSNRDGHGVDINTLSKDDKMYYDHQVKYYQQREVLKKAQDALRTEDLDINYSMTSDERTARPKEPANLYNGVPNMPYKETSQWIGFAMKRVMKLAAEEGFDMVSWTTGQQQADRYSLSETVDEIEVTKRPGADSYRLKITPRYGETIDRDYVSAKELPNMVGVELAKKIIAENKHPEESMESVLAKDEVYQKLAAERDSLDDIKGGVAQDGKSWFQASAAAQTYVDENYSKYQSYTTTYNELDLKMGGEGMKAFYDKMLPDSALSEFKRFDKSTRLKSIEVVVGDTDNELQYMQLATKARDSVNLYDAGKITALELKAKLLEQGVRVAFGVHDKVTFYDANVKSGYNTQQAIPITSKARMNLNSALPLFQNEQGAMVAADSKYVIYALTNPNVSTPLHEIAHVYENYMSAEEKTKVLKWSGQESWDTETSEKFARGFEKYLAEGKSPFAALQGVFDNFKSWLTDIYNGLVGSEIDVDLNDEMRVIYANMLGADAVTVFRGEGNNYSKGANSGFDWVSTEKELAEDYASYTRGKGYNVNSKAIDKPKSIFKLSYNANTHIRSENLGDHLRRIAGKKIKELELTMADWKSISKNIDTYEETAGDSLERYHTKLNKPEVVGVLSEILESLGFDAIELMEGDTKTYGLIKTNKNGKKGNRGVFSNSGQQETNKKPTFGKGSTSPQGFRLVEGQIPNVGQTAYYDSTAHTVTAVQGDAISISKQGESAFQVDKSKLLTEVAPEIETKEFSLTEKDPNNLNDDALNDAVFNIFRENNLEPSDDEVIGVSAYVKYTMDGKKTAKRAINDAVNKFKKAGKSPAANSVNKKAKGSGVTTPNITYNEAVRSNSKQKGDNLWVRNESTEGNEDRVLMVQFASSLLYGKESYKRSLNSKYFDSLYRLIPGYNRTSDFWEVPLWMGSIAGMESKSDVYIVRDPAEAQKFMDEAKYGRVLFSALDVNEKHIETIAKGLPNQKFSIGGYTNFDKLDALPNTDTFDSVEAYTKQYGVKDDGVYSYRHFKGTQVIPRLKMSEGCSYKCAFCSIPKKIIAMPQKDIDRMVDSMQDLDATLVYLDDKTFGQAKNFRALPAIYKKIKEYNPGFEGFIIQTTSVDFADKKRFGKEFLKASGIKYVELGIETYNDDILTKLNKKHSHKKFTDAAMQSIRENGLKAIPNVIVGLSWDENGVVKTEDAASYKRTYDFLEANKDIISHLNVYSLAIYEGTSLGDSIEVKEEADKNENIISKSWQNDKEVHIKAMDMFSKFALDQVERVVPAAPTNTAPVEPVRLGRLRYKETASTIEVDSSLLAPLVSQEVGKAPTSIKGLGLGSKMYAELFKYAAKVNKKLVSSDNLSPNSTKVWDKMVRIGVATKVGDSYEMKMQPEGFDSNGEPSLGSVVNFVEKEGTDGTLDEHAIGQLRETMIGMPVASSHDLVSRLKVGFFTEGYFKPTRKSLTKSKLYSSEEITDILSDESIQLGIKDYIYKLDRLDIDVLNDIYTDSAFLVIKDGTKNVLGKYNLANPYTFEKIAIERLGNIKTREEFESAILEDESLEALVEPYKSRKNTYDDLFYQFRDFKQAAVISVEDGVLVAQQSGTRELLANTLKTVDNDNLKDSIDALLETTPNVWNNNIQEVNTILREVEQELANIGVDATTLVETSVGKSIPEIKTFLTAVRNVILAENASNFEVLVIAYDTFFDKPNDYKFKNVKLGYRHEGKNNFYIESVETPMDLFKNFSLVPIGKNIYKRVNTTKTIEQLYEFIYDSTAAEGYTTILPQEAFAPAAFDEDGYINLSKLKDVNNREAILSGMKGFVASKTKEVYTGDTNMSLEELEKYVILFNFYNRSSNFSKFDRKPDVQTEYAIFLTEVSNAEYLTTDFASDFNASKVKAKLKNTAKYENYYKHFSVNNTGIHLDNSDPITLSKLKPYLNEDSNMKNYFQIKKDGFNYGVIAKQEPGNSELFLRNYYRNFPTALKPYTDNFQDLSPTTIMAPVKDAFIRTSKGVYEFVEGIGKLGIYGKIVENNGLFKDYDMNMVQPSVEGDTSRIKASDSSIVNEVKINNLYTGAEASKIDNKIDKCK